MSQKVFLIAQKRISIAYFPNFFLNASVNAGTIKKVSYVYPDGGRASTLGRTYLRR
jgi:hypothetical protein